MDVYHSGYCSWCFNDTKHELQEHNIFRRSVYRCSCGQRTLICRAPGCHDVSAFVNGHGAFKPAAAAYLHA
jgi:hypothetical protein